MGISNLFSGLIGGYTGSYIFSQTLFSLRRGVKSRVAGFVLAACELFLIVLPISVTSYLPKVKSYFLQEIIHADKVVLFMLSALYFTTGTVLL